LKLYWVIRVIGSDSETTGREGMRVSGLGP
jgi:hypothetical protein